MNNKQISYDAIKPGVFIRATWMYDGVTSIVEGVASSQEEGKWKTAGGSVLIGDTPPLSLIKVNIREDDSWDYLTDKIEYEDVIPGDHIHVITKTESAVARYDGFVRRVTEDAIYTAEGGVLIHEQDAAYSDIYLVGHEEIENLPTPLIQAVDFEEIEQGDYISTEWIENDVAYVIEGYASYMYGDEWHTNASVTIAAKAWDKTAVYEVKDGPTEDDTDGWQIMAPSAVQVSDLVLVKTLIADTVLYREGIVSYNNEGTLRTISNDVLYFSNQESVVHVLVHE